MRALTGTFLASLLFGTVQCQPKPYLFVQLDSTPDAARSVRVQVTRGAQNVMTLSPMALPNSGTGFSFRLDLPEAFTDSVDVAVSAFSGRDGTGCLLAGGLITAAPTSSVYLQLKSFVTPGASCQDGDVVVTEASPALLQTSAAGSTEITLTGWGFRPETQISIDGVPVQSSRYVSIAEARVVPGVPTKTGLLPISAANPDGVALSTPDLVRYYSNTFGFTRADRTLAEVFASGTINAMTAMRYKTPEPRLALAAPARGAYDVVLPKYDSEMPNHGGVALRPFSLYQTLPLVNPEFMVPGDLDVLPDQDMVVIDHRPSDTPQYQLAVANMNDPLLYSCENSAKFAAMVSAAIIDTDADKYNDIILGYNDGMIAVLPSNPRGIFIKTPSMGCYVASIPNATNSGLLALTSLQQVSAGNIHPKIQSGIVILAENKTQLYATYANGARGSNGTVGFQGTVNLDHTTQPIEALAVADVDGDGRADLIYTYRSGGQVMLGIRHNTSTDTAISYESSPTVVSLGKDCSGSTPLRFADLNDDTYLDIFIGCQNPDKVTASIEALISQGQAGKFASTLQSLSLGAVTLNNSKMQFELVQQSGDRRLDVVAATDQNLLVFQNDSK